MNSKTDYVKLPDIGGGLPEISGASPSKGRNSFLRSHRKSEEVDQLESDPDKSENKENKPNNQIEGSNKLIFPSIPPINNQNHLDKPELTRKDADIDHSAQKESARSIEYSGRSEKSAR